MEACPGARGAGLVDPDGIPLVLSPRDMSLEALGAEFASILRDVIEAGRELQHGDLRQVSVETENAHVVITATGGGYFLLLVLGHDSLVGKGKFLSRLAAERLYSEFI